MKTTTITFNANNMISNLLCDLLVGNQFYEIINCINWWMNTFESLNFLSYGQWIVKKLEVITRASHCCVAKLKKKINKIKHRIFRFSMAKLEEIFYLCNFGSVCPSIQFTEIGFCFHLSPFRFFTSTKISIFYYFFVLNVPFWIDSLIHYRKLKKKNSTRLH